MNQIKLHLGCGERYLKGYTNIDFPLAEHTTMKVKADVYQDVRTLNYAENSIDEIRTHHMFEHFSRQEALKLLCQWRAWLKVGGLLHIETPDFSACAAAYSRASLKRKFELTRHIFGSQDAKWAYHYDGWDKEKYRFVLKEFGFEKIKAKTIYNSFQRYYPRVPFGRFIGNLIPASIYRKRGGNKLPSIEVTAKKSDKAISEKTAIRKVLELSLVGKEGEVMLEQWMKNNV